MRKLTSFIVLIAMVVMVSACSQQAATPQDAIKQAEAKQTVEEKVDYLVGQANSFVSSEKFDEAITLAKHILAELDSNSEEAKGIIEQAKAQLASMAKEKAELLKAEANKAVGDAKSKLGSLGQ